MTMMTSSRLDDLCRDAGLDLCQTPVLLAVSGGADSMAMAHLFYEHGQRLGVSPS
jgi:tRNA(Ile)-lysidine synthase TilS/MesJ